MSRYQAADNDSGHFSDRRRDYYSPGPQSGKTSNSRVPGQENQPQGLNESYYRESAAALGIPMNDGSRSHSVPPPNSAVVRLPRSPSPSSSTSSSRSDRGRSHARSYRGASRDFERSPDPVHRARGIINSNFSQTRAGIGAGIVGAVVGGLIAKQASEAAFRRRQKQSGRPRRHSTENVPRVASTVLGAVAGALGANAITHRLEDARERNKSQQLAWEERHGREEDLPHYDTGRPQDLNHRNGKGYLYDARDYDDAGNGGYWKHDDRGPRRQYIEETRYYHERY